MGLNVKRFAFGALVLAAMLLPLRRAHRAGEIDVTATRQQRLDTLAWAYRKAQTSWSAFDLRDSAAAIAAKTLPNAPIPGSGWRGFAPGTSFPATDTNLATFWQHVGTTNPRVRTAVMYFRADTYRGGAYDGTYIATHGDHTDCVAIVPAYLGRDGKPSDSEKRLRSGLAPCALLTVFGSPGPAVGAWLTATRYSSATSNSWFVAENHGWQRGPWMQWSNSDRGDAWPESSYDLMRTTGLIEIAYILRPPYAYGSAGLRCINGESAECVAGILHPDLAVPSPTAVPAELTLGTSLLEPPATTLSTIRPPNASILAALITEFGRERFQKFWSSPQPFEAAFLDAFGEPLGEWTAHWARDTWMTTDEAQHINADVLLGVTLKPDWLPVTVLWTILALSVAAWVARRRTA